MAQNKKQKEKKYLIDFFNSHVGQKWKAQQGIISYEETESPDFIFLTNKNKKIGMEITNFFAKSKHCRATQVLTNIGNKVCRYCHKKYNLEISILIDKYDKRIGQPKSKEELWDLYYNPGFTNIFNEEEIKPKIEKTIDENLINVKATTEEGLGFTGNGEGISSQAIASISLATEQSYGALNCGGCGSCTAR